MYFSETIIPSVALSYFPQNGKWQQQFFTSKFHGHSILQQCYNLYYFFCYILFLKLRVFNLCNFEMLLLIFLPRFNLTNAMSKYRNKDDATNVGNDVEQKIIFKSSANNHEPPQATTTDNCSIFFSSWRVTLLNYSCLNKLGSKSNIIVVVLLD